PRQLRIPPRQSAAQRKRPCRSKAFFADLQRSTGLSALRAPAVANCHGQHTQAHQGQHGRLRYGLVIDAQLRALDEKVSDRGQQRNLQRTVEQAVEIDIELIGSGGDDAYVPLPAVSESE